MDILTHTLSGFAVATCVASFVPKVKKRLGILAVGALGGAFPDLDAISLWSRFDATIGKLFSLPAKGSLIYGSKFWYSHHAFLHSLFGSLLLGALLILVLYLCSKKKENFIVFAKDKMLYFIAFVFGYWVHLAGDLPTPSSVWGGIGFFWPSLEYVGGYGKIWWWNNYDIFLIIVVAIFLNLIVLSCSRFLKDRTKILTSSLLAIGLVFILIQINTRQFDYAYSTDSSKYTQMERNSKLEQERILGKSLYSMMVSFDYKLKIYF